MDKSVFRAYESYWDEEVMLLWTQQACGQGDSIEEIYADRVIRKSKFGKIFSRAWTKAATPSNVMSGFKATGIYPFDPSAIKDEAFAPSELTQRQQNKEPVNEREIIKKIVRKKSKKETSTLHYLIANFLPMIHSQTTLMSVTVKRNPL
ncbi:hypothetical protein QE152_g40635 [Popillia japonica]|uniref:Uncharacterized protein n=1 Tax=Popillia japonica TaxID=7064 RepID=A0AAW1HFT3_POPJA